MDMFFGVNSGLSHIDRFASIEECNRSFEHRGKQLSLGIFRFDREEDICWTLRGAYRQTPTVRLQP